MIAEERTGPIDEARAQKVLGEAWAESGLVGAQVYREGLDLVRNFVRSEGVVDHRDVLAVEKEDVGSPSVVGRFQRSSLHIARTPIYTLDGLRLRGASLGDAGSPSVFGRFRRPSFRIATTPIYTLDGPCACEVPLWRHVLSRWREARTNEL